MTNQVIPAQAVEAAAKALLATPADYPGEDRKKEWAEFIMRAALEAAAPYMLAAAWEEGHDAGFTYGAFQGRVQESPNPYMLNNEGEK